MPGKRITFDDETWAAVDLLARDRMMDFQELADEAFRDLLNKYGRPTELKVALRRSAEKSNTERSAGEERRTTTTHRGGAHGARAGTRRRARR